MSSSTIGIGIDTGISSARVVVVAWADGPTVEAGTHVSARVGGSAVAPGEARA